MPRCPSFGDTFGRTEVVLPCRFGAQGDCHFGKELYSRRVLKCYRFRAKRTVGNAPPIRPLQAEFRFAAILLNSAAMKTSKRTVRRTCTRIVASVKHKNRCVQLLAFLLLAAAPLLAHP